MNITIPVVIFWIIVFIIVSYASYVIHVIVGISKRKYLDSDSDIKISQFNSKLDLILKKLGEEDEQGKPE